VVGEICEQILLNETYLFHFYLLTNDKGRLAPLTCHTVQTLKSAVKV